MHLCTVRIGVLISRPPCRSEMKLLRIQSVFGSVFRVFWTFIFGFSKDIQVPTSGRVREQTTWGATVLSVSETLIYNHVSNWEKIPFYKQTFEYMRARNCVILYTLYTLDYMSAWVAINVSALSDCLNVVKQCLTVCFHKSCIMYKSWQCLQCQVLQKAH